MSQLTIEDTTPLVKVAAPAAPPVVRRRVQLIRFALATAVWAVPLLRPAGPGNTGPVDIAVVFAVLITMLWVSGQGHRIRLPYAFPVCLSIVGGALAAVVTYLGRAGGVGGGLLALIQDAFLLLWVVAIANAGRIPGLLRSVTRAAAISVTIWSVVLILAVIGHVTALSGVTPRTGSRAAFTLGDANLAANYFICMLFILRAAQYPRRRAARWACCTLILVAIFLTGSNGGALALVAASLAGSVFALARRRGVAPAVLLVSAAVIIGTTVVPHIHVQSLAAKAQTSLPILRDSIGRQAESSNSRTIILNQTINLYFTGDTPLGLGPGGIKAALKAKQYPYVKMAHDDYAAAIVERGLIGALGLVILVLIVCTRARRIATRPLKSRYADVIPRPELLGAGAVAMFISAFFYEVLHFRHVWLLFGLIAALDLWGRRDRDGQTPYPPDMAGLRQTVTDLAWRLRQRSPRAAPARAPIRIPVPAPAPAAAGALATGGALPAAGTLTPAADALTVDVLGPLDVFDAPAAPDTAGLDAPQIREDLDAADARDALEAADIRHTPGTTAAPVPSATPGTAGAWRPAALLRRFRRMVPAVLTANVAARLVALGALALATILVARAGGPKLVGELTLLRVLPGLAGVLACCGLPTAVPFFLARRDVTRPRLWTTLVLLMFVGSLLAGAGWLVLSPVLHRVFFKLWGMGVVLAAAVPVFSQLFVAVGKSFLQGENDMRGANLAIAAEEAAFLPVYLVLLPFMHGTAILMSALVGADLLVAAGICLRLARRGLLRRWGRPDFRLAVEVCRYGLRGQVGGILSLVNLRLDVAILGALAGPGVLGVYAVASKYAELLRLPGLAVTYVLYPRLAMRDRAEAGRRVAALMPRAFGLTVLVAIPLAAAVPLLPLVYGHAFTPAVLPSYLLLIGLVGEGVAGLVSAYLYGVGRPGANSLALGVAVVVTVVLDLMLIPRYHAVGAAVASAAAYLTSSGALLGCYFAVRRAFVKTSTTPTAVGAS